MHAEETRVLVVAPVGQDAPALTALLRGQGIRAEACAGAADCLAGLQAGAGALVLTEEALELPGAAELLEGFRHQPAWSELPLIILTSGGESRSARLLEIAAAVAGAVTLLERPMRAATLLHSVQVALRSRQRQYQVRDLLGQRERAEAALRASEHRLREELAVSRALQALSTHVIEADHLEALYEPILDTAVAILHSDFASLQMFYPARGQGELRLLGHRGFSPQAAKHWEWVNPASESACGIALRRRQRVFVPDVRQCHFLAGSEDLACYLGTGIVAVQTTPLISRSGALLGTISTHWRQVHEPTEGELGALDVLARMAADLIERRRAEEALRESERLLREFLEQLPVGAALMGRQGEIRVSNEAYRRLVPGRIPSRDPERLGRWRTWDAAGQPVAPANWPGARALRGERVVPGMEFLYTEADGREVWQRVTALPFRDAAGEMAGALSVVENIDAVKRATERLRESEERLRLAQSAGGLGIFDYDIVSGGLRWDQRLREWWGLGPEEPVTYELFMAGVHPEDRAPTQAAVDRALAPGGDGLYQAEFRVVSVADERRRWVAATGKVTFQDGRAVRLVGVAQDITQRREFQAELERLVAERTAELRELVGELEHFSYSITHDMRAPLRAMMGFAEVAKELGAEGADQEQQLFLDRIQTAARRMDLLITDALNYSRVVRSELPLAPVDVGRLLRGMVDTYPELQGAQGGIRIEPELPLVLGNEAGLTQCFSNLLGNAVKFVRPGQVPEIRVWAELRPPAASPAQPDSLASGPLTPLSSPFSAPFVRIWVEDHGTGISRKMLPRVFDMFARGASQQAGTGIGLALVRKVVERMGGRVGVESEEGHGSRFWVELRSGEVRRRGGV